MRKLIPLLLLLSAARLRSADLPVGDKVDFTRIVKPILESSCIKCHGDERSHGEVRLDTKELAFQAASVTGRAIVPGKPERSSLYTTSVVPDDDLTAMPPRDRDKLTAPQAEQIRRWIEQGAEWPEGVTLKRIDKVSFVVVASILQTSCFKCHSKTRAEGSLRLDNRNVAMKGGKSGVAIVPYSPETSRAYLTLLSPSVHDKNPPRLLTEDDIAQFREWIRQGAAWPDDMAYITPDAAETAAPVIDSHK